MGLVAPDDIGQFAVAAFLNPAKFNKREFDLASENLTAEQIVEVLQDVSGKFICSNWEKSIKINNFTYLGKKIKIVQFTEQEAETHPSKGWQFPHLLNNAAKCKLFVVFIILVY